MMGTIQDIKRTAGTFDEALSQQRKEAAPHRKRKASVNR